MPVAEVTDLLRQLQNANGLIERGRVMVRAAGVFSELTPVERRVVGRALAEQGAPDLSEQLAGRSGGRLSSSQVRSVADGLLDMDDQQIGSLRQHLADPDERRRLTQEALAAASGAAASGAAASGAAASGAAASGAAASNTADTSDAPPPPPPTPGTMTSGPASGPSASGMPAEVDAPGDIDLAETDLGDVNLGETDLGETDLGEASLGEAGLGRVDLRQAELSKPGLGDAGSDETSRDTSTDDIATDAAADGRNEGTDGGDAKNAVDWGPGAAAHTDEASSLGSDSSTDVVEGPDRPAVPPVPASAPAIATAPGVKALQQRLNAATSATARLRMVAEEATTIPAEAWLALLDGIPDGWQRRRAAERLVEAGRFPTTDLKRAFARFGRANDAMFVASALTSAGTIEAAQLRGVLDDAVVDRLAVRASR